MANLIRPGSLPVDASSLPKWTDIVVGADRATYSLEAIEAARLEKQMIDTDLVMNTVIDDVFAQDIVNINAYSEQSRQAGQLPSGMVMKVTADKGTKHVTKAFRDPYSGPLRAGRDEQTGHEVGRGVKWMQFWQNEESFASMIENWGENYNDLEANLGLYRTTQPDLSLFFKEVTGRQYREATIWTYSRELVKDNALISQGLNPNILVANSAPGSIVYNENHSTMLAALITQMQLADTGTNGANANLTIEFLEVLNIYARVNKKIRPLKLGNGAKYIVLLPSDQVANLTKLTGTVGNAWTDRTALQDMKYNYTGVLGKYRDLLIVEDDRYATMTANYGAGTVTTGYVEAGNNDQRNLNEYDATTNQTWSCGCLYGGNAIADWTKTEIHFEEQPYEYKKRVGIGAFRERGIQLALQRNDKENVTTKRSTYSDNFGSILLMFTNNAVYKHVA